MRDQITIITGDATVRQKKRSKTQKAKKKSPRPVAKESRPAVGVAKKSDTKAAHHLDKIVKKFEGAVEDLQSNLEQLRAALPDLVALGVRRDRLRRIKALADDGILDSLQRLATAIDVCAVKGVLPESLVSLNGSARMAIDHLSRTFEVEAVYQPGESLTVAQEKVKDFDWSADRSGKLDLPAEVVILRSGWRAADVLFVLPKAVRRARASAQSE